MSLARWSIFSVVSLFLICFSDCSRSETKVLPPSIHILSATYGKEGKTCDGRTYLAKNCDGKDRCEVLANNAICGDSNPYVLKQLDVEYSCGGASVRHTTATEYFFAELTCSNAPRLAINVSAARVEHGQPTISTEPNCIEQSLREGADKNSNPQAACKRLCVKLPAGTKVRKIYGFAKESEGADYLPCQIDANGIFHSEMHCNIENCAFYPQYQTTVDSVCWTFRNWSLSGSREAKVVVQYEQ